MIIILGLVAGLHFENTAVAQPTISIPITKTLAVTSGPFTIYNGTITAYNSEKDSNFPNVVIPAEIEGEKVTAIGERVFNHIGLKSVVIPNGITSIGAFAFNGNDLTQLNLPQSVKTIGTYAFNGNHLTTLKLNEGLVNIDASAFSFNNLTNVDFPSTLKTIGSSAFALNQLDKVTLNNGLQTIGNNAFTSNHILGINLPSSVDELGKGVLAENSVWITPDEVSNYNYAQKTFTVNWQKILLDHGIDSNQFTLHSAVAYAQDIVSPLTITLATKDATVKLTNYDPIEFNKERTLFEPFEISSTNGKVILSQDIPIRFRNDMIFMDLGALTPTMTINQGDSLNFKDNIHAFDMHDGIVPYTITANGKPITSTSSLAPGTYHIVITASDVTGDSVDDNIPESISKSITLIILPTKDTVTFDSNGGTDVPSQTVDQGNTATEPTPPTKLNHTFSGWYTDPSCTTPWDPADPIEKDTTLYAKWTPIKDTITFNSNGGTDVPTQTVDQGNTAAEPTPPTKLNHTFSGWYTDPNCTTPWDPADPIEKDTTLYAKWTPIKDSITFNSNGGTDVPSQTVDQGSTATEPTPPTKLNHTFSGWYTDPSCTTPWNPADPIEKDTTLYAKWTPIKDSITFNSNGGTDVPAQTVDQGSTATEPTPPTKLNNTFSGWYTDPSFTTPWNPSVPVKSDTTLYAKWTPISPAKLSLVEEPIKRPSKDYYAIEFIVWNEIITEYIKYEEPIDYPAFPLVKGFEFDGWYLDEAHLIKWSEYKFPFKFDIILYSKWKETTPNM